MKRCAHLSLSLSLGVVARDDDDDDRRERERERERKNRKLCAIYFVPFRARKKNFSESFFSSSYSLSKRTTRDAFEQQQQRHKQKRERKRERERETSFSLSRDRKNALLSALLCVCAGVRKKTILINLKIKQEQKTFYLFWIFASLDFLRSSFWTVFLKFTSRPQFFLKSYEDMNTESKNNSNNENKSPTGRRRIQIEDIRYARNKILSGFCDGGGVATAFGESSSSSPSPVVAREEASRRAMEGLLLLDDEDDSDDDSDDDDKEGLLLEKAISTKLLPKETKAVVDMIRRDASNALKFALMSCGCSNKNPTVAGEVFATREILFPGRGGVLGEGKEERDDDENDFDDDDIADIKDKILSRKTMEFWEAAVSRIEFEYERRNDSARIEAAAKRVRARYNEFLSQYVYALDAKYREDKENRSANEAMDNLKLRVSLLKDAVMKRREGDKARIFSKKFALEAKHLLVELKMPSPEAVALYQFVSSIDLANNK